MTSTQDEDDDCYLEELEDGGHILYVTDPITGRVRRDADGQKVVRLRRTGEEARAHNEYMRRSLAEAPIRASEDVARRTVEDSLEGFLGFHVDEGGELEEGHPRRLARTLVALDAIKLAADAVRSDVMQKAGAETLREALILIEDTKAN